ncbi:hypothetical protein TNCV_4049621 [Trichonephila clavipes]|nr:hypothetical protein TNCV_4049621 [Trichonephila clavipes]
MPLRRCRTPYSQSENFECSHVFEEDFGKRNMQGKRARRHFSQLSEFERGEFEHRDENCRLVDALCCCQVDHSECAVRNFCEQWTRERTHVRKTGFGATRKTMRREE